MPAPPNRENEHSQTFRRGGRLRVPNCRYIFWRRPQLLQWTGKNGRGWCKKWNSREHEKRLKNVLAKLGTRTRAHFRMEDRKKNLPRGPFKRSKVLWKLSEKRSTVEEEAAPKDRRIERECQILGPQHTRKLVMPTLESQFWGVWILKLIIFPKVYLQVHFEMIFFS